MPVVCAFVLPSFTFILIGAIIGIVISLSLARNKFSFSVARTFCFSKKIVSPLKSAKSVKKDKICRILDCELLVSKKFSVRALDDVEVKTVHKFLRNSALEMKVVCIGLNA